MEINDKTKGSPGNAKFDIHENKDIYTKKLHKPVLTTGNTNATM